MLSSNEKMSIEGKGTVVLRGVLSDGSISVFKINNVLYLPKLSLPLFSWEKARSKGYKLEDNGFKMKVNKNSKTWLEAYCDGLLPIIKETADNIEVTCSTLSSGMKPFVI